MKNMLVLKFILYWDGFSVSSRTEASGSGLYVTWINLPPPLRSSPAFIRVLTLTPPGCAETVVLPHVLPDLEKCMTEGLVVRDISGRILRVFRELAICLVDTPVVMKAVQCVAHTDISCCHLRTYPRDKSDDIHAR